MRVPRGQVGGVTVSSSQPVSQPADREALRRRFDEELAQLQELPVSSWLLQQPADEQQAAPGEPASEINVDVALAPVLVELRRQLAAFPGHCAHITSGDGAMLAIFRPDTNTVFVRDRVDVHELGELSWRPRPMGAAQPPRGWRVTTADAIQWRFSLLGPAGDQALARHWRHAPLVLRETPPFNFSLVRGRQFELLHLLQSGPRTFADIARRVGGDEAQLSRELVTLMLMGCLVIG